MKFEIINPSDACTMHAPDLEVAAVAVSFLGDGKYPLEGLDDAAGQGVPAFLFGGHDEWFSSKFGMSFQDTAEHVLNHRNEELATTLDSVTLRGTTRTSIQHRRGLRRGSRGLLRKIDPRQYWAAAGAFPRFSAVKESLTPHRTSTATQAASTSLVCR